MRALNATAAKGTNDRRPRMVMLSAGIILFVSGFIITIATFPAAESSGDGARESAYDGFGLSGQFVLAFGVMVSLVGVVLATVLPTAIAVRAKRKR